MTENEGEGCSDATEAYCPDLTDIREAIDVLRMLPPPAADNVFVVKLSLTITLTNTICPHFFKKC